VRCGDALARQASVDAQGYANSDRRQSSEQRHFALAFLASGRSLGIVVWSHHDCDYSICEGRDIRDFYGDAQCQSFGAIGLADEARCPTADAMAAAVIARTGLSALADQAAGQAAQAGN
jgi:hypothetical protein